MPIYRLYFRDDSAICGRDDFEASGDAEALALAEIVADACSDVCTRFEVWEGRRVIGEGRTRSVSPSPSTTLVTAIEQRQQLAIERVLAIKDSKFRVARSHRLSATVQELNAIIARSPRRGRSAS